MNVHLTDTELIEYQFKLASERQAASAASHLEKCEACRKRLGALARRLSTLDVLKEEVAAPDALVEDVLKRERVTRPAAAPIRLLTPVWMAGLGTAAAAATILFLLLHQPEYTEPTRGETGRAPTVAGQAVSKYGKHMKPAAGLEKQDARGAPAIADGETIITEEMAERKSKWAAPAQPARVRVRLAEEIEALRTTRPFAPASRIELVTLPRRDKVQMTIYNAADLTLVRERRNLTFKRGWNWLQFMWANTFIDPTSLSLEPMSHKSDVEIQQLAFPPGLKELGRWLIFSSISGEVPFEITYFTSGLSWRAFYMGTLAPDEQTMRLQGYVRVTNSSGEDYENAQTRLIVGKVHVLDEIATLATRRYPYGRPGRESGIDDCICAGEELSYVRRRHKKGRALLGAADFERKEITKEGLSEYFLYTIEGEETIPHRWAKRLPSFQAGDVPVLNLYKFEEERYGNAVIRFLSFKNDKEHKLGDTPIPGGVLKVYGTADAAGLLSYVGHSRFKYIPVDEDIELSLGPVKNVMVEPKLVGFTTSRYMFDRKGNVCGWEESATFKVEVSNTREVPVKVEIKRNFGTPYWELEKSGDCGEYEKVDLDTIKFTLTLSARSKREFTYTITTRHGTRE